MEPIKYFFSYSRQNSEFVITLAAELKNAGANVWLDQTDIAPGMRWDDSIQNALNESRGLLVVLSVDSVKSQNVMDEVSFAISNGKRIVPLMIESCSVPFRLARYQHIDFTEDYDTAFQQLLQTLHADESNPLMPATFQKTSELQSKEKVLSKEGNENLLNRFGVSNITKLIGALFIVLACAMTLFNKCPTNVQYFIIYTLIGVGIAMLLAKSAGQSIATFKAWNLGVSLSGGVALPFILFFTNPIGSFKEDICDLPLTTSVTVFVHGKKGKQDMVLRQQGHVIMDIKGGERKRADLNENGAAFFQNLHIGDTVQLEVDFSEPYKSLYPDSAFLVPTDGRIYLPVALQGIGKVHGKVLFNDEPLAGVIIELNELTDTTDNTGRFNITIPESQQTKEYKVWFTKQGFKTKSAPAFPQTGQPLEIIMEK